MRAAPSKPAVIKRQEGNRAHKPIEDDLPMPLGIPEVPSELEGDAVTEWRRVTTILADTGILSTLDLAVLTTYCQAWGRFLELERALKTVSVQDMIEEPRSGYERILVQSHKVSEQLRKVAQDLGFTPASRARIPAPQKKDDSAAAKFFDA